MNWILAAVVAISWALAGAAMADPSAVTVPIEPAPTPITPPLHAAPPVGAPMPDARSLSQINPTAGPAVPPKVTIKPAHKAAARTTIAITKQQRETAALNELAAAGYGQFHDLHWTGRDYQATVDDPRGAYIVTVDPDNGWITPPSAAADRETRALNLLTDRGYVQVNAIRSARTGFVATVTRDGRVHEVTVDPDSGRIQRSD